MILSSPFQKMQRGFTLIEVLIAVAIIGMLSAVVYASFGDSRMVARDDERQANLKNMQVAIELYKAQYGRYPNACRGAGNWSGGDDYSGTGFGCPSSAPPVDGCINDYVCGLTPDFIKTLPIDPNTAGKLAYIYVVNGAGTSYKLMSHQRVEKKLITSYADDFARCPAEVPNGACPVGAPQSNTYAVYGGTAYLNS